MENIDYIAVAALILSMVSLLISMRSDRRTAAIEREERRRELLTQLMALQGRLDRTLPLAKTVVVEFAEQEGKAKEIGFGFVSTVKAMERMEQDAAKYLTDSKMLEKLDQHGIEKELTWVALGKEMLDQVEAKLSGLLELSQVMKQMKSNK